MSIRGITFKPGCYVDGDRGVYAVDAIVSLAEGYGIRVGGVDIARMGDDKCAYVILQQMGALHWEEVYCDEWDKRDLNYTTGRILQISQEMGVDKVAIDVDGLGVGAYDSLKYGRELDYFVPFTHINFLNEGHTRQLVRTGHFTQARDKSFLHVNRYTGGCIVFTRELFDSVCGFPEEVLGWGKEDDIFLTKCKRIGAKIGRIEENNTLLHLFHTPSSTKEYMKSEQYLKNSKLLALFKRMKDEEFYQYIDDKEFILRDSLLENLYSKYDKEKKLETNVKVYCGTGFVKFDTSGYTIIPDENGNIGLEELFSAAYNEDGDESVAHTIREIDKNCRNLSPEHESIVKKYRDLTTQ